MFYLNGRILIISYMNTNNKKLILSQYCMTRFWQFIVRFDCATWYIKRFHHDKAGGSEISKKNTEGKPYPKQMLIGCSGSKEDKSRRA